jgi:phosphatidate cytidylyltransferase
LAAFVVEMATFHVPGESVARVSLVVWIAAYLGLLPSFLVQLRWLPDLETSFPNQRATAALMLAIFVPKCGDIGAYFTGRFLGRHRMAPTLSPKKTWEGAAGGVTASVLAAVGIDRLGPVVRGGWTSAALLGAVLGIVGIVGDLAESLIKRDCRQKDASQVVPGFGGVLDVVDSIVFTAPVAYWWIR